MVRETHGQVPDHDADVTMSSKPSETFLDGNMSIVCQNKPESMPSFQMRGLGNPTIVCGLSIFHLNQFPKGFALATCGAKAA